MKRDLNILTTHCFELLVIGGGIYGACLAWEASRRGLSVALVEKADFASGTSANSLKIIHGGLRYLQQADIRRMRESIGERRRLMQLAPHLVHPLPVVIPTSGHGLRSREAMSLALAANDLISCDRNWQMDPQKRIPRGRTISKQECLARLPGLSPDSLTGGAIFYDAQVYNSERLVLAFLRSAVESGAAIANYVEVSGFLHRGDRVVGVTARDQLTGAGLEVQAKTVINAAGPWINSLLDPLQPPAKISFAKAFNVVTRPLFQDYAVGISSPKVYRDADNWVNKGSRLFFIAPWRGYSLIGTAYEVCDQGPETFQITEDEIQTFLDDLNRAYPPANLTREDVRWVHRGLLPSSGVSQSGDVQLTKHYQILDHRQQGHSGLFSVIGIKYTTARDVAEKAVNQVFPDRRPADRSAPPPLYGGEIEQFEPFLQQALQQRPQGLDPAAMERLVYNYGSAYPAVLRYLQEPAAHPFAVLRAEVRYGVQEEMAQTLGDILFRRTELGSAGLPEVEVSQICAETLGEELGWSPTRIAQELQAIGYSSVPAPL